MAKLRGVLATGEKGDYYLSLEVTWSALIIEGDVVVLVCFVPVVEAVM